MEKKRKCFKPDDKWLVVVVCVLVLFVGVGFCSSAKNIYIAPITSAMGFSRSAFTMSDAFRYATAAIASLFTDKLIKRFGIKKMLLTGMTFYVISSLFNAFATSLYMFYLGGISLGIAFAFAATTMVSIIINKWFTGGKGTLLGVIFASNGLGAVVAISLFEPLIYEDGNPFGFRNAFLLSAALVAIVTIIIAFLYKERDDKDNVAEAIESEDAESCGMEYKELCRKPSFYIVAISLLLVSLTSLYCIAPPHFTDIGFDSSFVALTLSVSSAGLIFSKILIGIIYDKFGIRTAVNTCFFADLVSKLILFVVTATTTGKVLAIAQCVLKAIAMPIETVMISIIVLDLFGKKSFTKALVINSALFTIGNALNQPLLNLAFDISGEYTISFIVSSVASAFVLILMNFAITSLKKGAKEDIASVKR